jgi:hypothetical protein
MKGKKTGGRVKGVPNKINALLKDEILKGAEIAGGKGGRVAYFARQANESPAAFLTLLGKVLPTELAHSGSIDTSSKEQKDAAIAAYFRANT